MKTRLVASAFLAGFLLIAAPRAASAHCDTMSGPVVLAAQKALETRDVNHVLPWIQPQDEAAIRGVFASQAPAQLPRNTALRPLAEIEREYVLHVLGACGGSQAEAARILGIGRNTLWRRLRRWSPAP